MINDNTIDQVKYYKLKFFYCQQCGLYEKYLKLYPSQNLEDKVTTYLEL